MILNAGDTLQLTSVGIGSWPGRANERFRLVAGNLLLGGARRQDSRARRDGQFVAGSGTCGVRVGGMISSAELTDDDAEPTAQDGRNQHVNSGVIPA